MLLRHPARLGRRRESAAFSVNHPLAGNRAAKGRPKLVMARALGSTAAWLRNEDGAQERESWVKATRGRWTLTEREVDRRACAIWPHIDHNRDGPRLDPIDVTVCHAGASPEPFEIH
jgi:hypothetical protein